MQRSLSKQKHQQRQQQQRRMLRLQPLQWMQPARSQLVLMSLQQQL
jgi:hypothetical protein